MALPDPSATSAVVIDARMFTLAAKAYGEKWDAFAAAEVDRAMDQCAEIVQRAVRKRAKRHYRTGRLEKNVRIKSSGMGWTRKVSVHSGGHAAHLVAGPVRAHMIVPRGVHDRAMPLYVGGVIIGFSEAVRHKATKGDPYFRVGVNNSRIAINSVVKASTKRLLKHLAELTEGK